MSSSFKGYWINGSKKTGYTAYDYNSNSETPLQDADGKIVRLSMAGIKRAIANVKPTFSADKIRANV